MRAGRVLRQIVRARIMAQVPALAGKVFDRATEGLAYPYATLGPSYWSDTSVLTMHPLSVSLVRIMDDPDGVSVHGVVQVEAMVERDA